MSDPFTEWRAPGQSPYWTRDDTAEDDARLERLRAKAAIHLPTPAKHAPNPLARSWHDS
jgi:hypothetical protein